MTEKFQKVEDHELIPIDQRPLEQIVKDMHERLKWMLQQLPKQRGARAVIEMVDKMKYIQRRGVNYILNRNN